MERMRPEIDLLEQLTYGDDVTLAIAAAMFGGDAGRARRVAHAVLSEGFAEMFEGGSLAPEWRWRELVRTGDAWRGACRVGSGWVLRGTPKVAAAFQADSASFFDRLFGDR